MLFWEWCFLHRHRVNGPPVFLLNVVITGFNTDVPYNGVTYHVQTEDKGIDTPMILSLVFDRGTILAAKRSPYDDLLGDGLDEKVLEERLQRQHKLICAAIRAGRLEDLKKMTSAAANAAGIKAFDAGPDIELPAGIPMPDGPPVWDIPLIEDVEVLDDSGLSLASDKPGAASQPAVETEAEVVDAEPVDLPPEIVPPSFDEEGKLKIKLFGSEKFITGERRNINVLVCRGADDESVAGASVMIKILGSDFRPLIFHAKADSNGIAAAMIKIPSFRSGRAAVLIRAMVGGEEAEMRRMISHLR